MKRIAGIIAAVCVSLSSLTAFASGVLPDHNGTSLDYFEIGTAPLGQSVRQYSDIFKRAGDQYGVDPNLLAAICMQESSGINWSYREDGVTPYPAWGIMQIEYTLEKTFAKFGKDTTGVEWTLEDRLDPEKSVPFAAYLISQSLIRYDCDYVKMIQSYNFGQTVLDKILAEFEGDTWLDERKNAAKYAVNWEAETYGDAEYVEHVLRYYHKDIDYIGAKVRVNGKLIAFEDQYPIILDEGYTFVPIRGVAEALNAKVSWNQRNMEATIEKGGNEIVIPIGSDCAYVNGEEYYLDSPSRLINDRTMVPFRFIAENLDCDVDWDDATHTVLIEE